MGYFRRRTEAAEELAAQTERLAGLTSEQLALEKEAARLRDAAGDQGDRS